MTTNNLILSYGGVTPPSFFIAEKIESELLPVIDIKTMDIPKKAGAYFIDKKYGVRTFSIPFTIIANNEDSVMYTADDLAEWLNYDEPQKLVFRDKPDHYYMAIVNGSTDYTKSFQLGRGTLEFICYDPHATGNEHEYVFAPQNTSPIIYTNLGNKETYPKINLTFTKNLTDWAIVTDNDALIFGDFDPMENTSADLQPLYIDDTGASTNGYTTAGTVDGGIVAGTLYSNGYVIQQKDMDYGTNANGWHGGSLVKSLGRQCQDFLLSCRVGFKSDNINQLGRIEVILLDINGKKIGKMAMRDNHATADLPNFEAWAGGVDLGGTQFRNTYGNYTGQYKGFEGIIRIGRTGKKWYCYSAKLDSNNRHIESTIMRKDFWDRSLKYQDKVAGIQIHIGAAKGYAPVKNMWVANIRFFEELKAQTGQVNYIFRNGDKLEIDCEKGEIFKNGEPFYDELYASSSFLKFDKGTNGVSVSDAGFKDGVLKFSERWL